MIPHPASTLCKLLFLPFILVLLLDPRPATSFIPIPLRSSIPYTLGPHHRSRILDRCRENMSKDSQPSTRSPSPEGSGLPEGIFHEKGNDEGQFVKRDPGKKRKNEESVLTYVMRGPKVMEMDHTYTPESMRGQGIAEQLCIAAFDYCRREGIIVQPTCTYIVDRFVSKHPEYNDILAKSKKTKNSRM